MGSLCCCCGRNSVARVGTPKPVATTKPVVRIPQENPGKARFSGIGVSTTDQSKLIGGYEKEPLVSLEEALKPFHGKVDNLDQHIKEAKAKCCHPSKHKLTHDESAAIYIYSMRWSKVSVHDHLQSAWKSEQRSALVPWFKYLKLFRSGLDKLPDAKGEVWQSASFHEEQKKLLTSNTKPLYTSLGSGSPSEQHLRGHFGKDPTGKMIFTSYGYTNGKVVTGYTADHGEEVMLWPGTKLGKAESKDHPDGTLMVHFNRKQKHIAEPTSPKTSANTTKHFVCPYKGCSNRCPGDHPSDHCRTFSILAHSVDHHHCVAPCNACEKCGRCVSKLFRCNRCGIASCDKCCYK